jgi:uncharacterized protein
VNTESKYVIQRLREGYLKEKYPHKKFGPGQIVLKMTNGCNLECVYCYSNAGMNNKISYIKPDMIVDFFDQYFEICRNSMVNCTFHGGEPLLKFELIKELIEKLRQKYYYPRLMFMIQTNATLINRNNIDFLKNTFKTVGVSFDGIYDVQGLTRPKCNGENSFDDFTRGIELLREYDIGCGALMVMTKHNKGHLIETLNWCVDHHIYGIGIEMVFPGGRGSKHRDLAISVDDYYDEMKEALYWQIGYNKISNSKFYIRDFETITKKIVFHEEGHMCANIPCGAGSKEISLDYNGDVYVCDSFDGLPEFSMGNVYKNKITEILEAPIVDKFANRNVDNIECCECKQKEICILGCPVRNWIKDNNLFGRHYMCEYYKRLSAVLYNLLVIQKFDPSLFTHTEGRIIDYDKVCKLDIGETI